MPCDKYWEEELNREGVECDFMSNGQRGLCDRVTVVVSSKISGSIYKNVIRVRTDPELWLIPAAPVPSRSSGSWEVLNKYLVSE